jgi:hypothetical protein
VKFQALQMIDEAERVDAIYTKIHKVMRRQSLSKNSLIKQDGWIAVCAHEDLRGDLSNILRALQEYNYTDLTAASWNFLMPTVMTVQVSLQGMTEFSTQNLDWYVLFSGEPDWIIVFANPLDFWLVAGKPDFVKTVLGCSPSEAFSSIEQMLIESRFLTETGREHFSLLIHQLREIYPSAETGSLIDFEFT